MKVTHPESRAPCAHGLPIFTIYIHTHMFSNSKGKKKSKNNLWAYIIYQNLDLNLHSLLQKGPKQPSIYQLHTPDFTCETFSCKAVLNILSGLRCLLLCLWCTRDTTHPWDTTTEAAFCTLHNHYLAVKMEVHVREALVGFCFIRTLANLQRLPG